MLKRKREGRHLERSELNWLCRAIRRKRRALKREKLLTKVRESAETVKAPKKTQSKHFNCSSIAKRENPETVLTSFFQDLCSIPADQSDLCPSRENSLDRALWKNLRMDCAGGTLISTKKLERFLSKLKMGKVHRTRSHRMFCILIVSHHWFVILNIPTKHLTKPMSGSLSLKRNIVTCFDRHSSTYPCETGLAHRMSTPADHLCVQSAASTSLKIIAVYKFLRQVLAHSTACPQILKNNADQLSPATGVAMPRFWYKPNIGESPFV